MKKQQQKPIARDAVSEIKRHFDVVAEGLDSKISLIAESLTGIQRQLIVVRDMVAKNTEDIEIMKSDMAFIKGGIKKKVDYEEFMALERRVTFVEAKARR